MPTRSNFGTYRLRRDEDDVPLLNHELARPGVRLKDLVVAGVSWMTLQRIRHGTAEGCGEATTSSTAYKIAIALDPEHPEATVKQLFEVVQSSRAEPCARALRALASHNRRGLVDKLVVLEGRHHEQGKVHHDAPPLAVAHGARHWA